MTQWDFQNKGKSGLTGKSSFVLKVPLRHLRPSVIYSVPCDWILQMAYFSINFVSVQSIHVTLSSCFDVIPIEPARVPVSYVIGSLTGSGECYHSGC